MLESEIWNYKVFYPYLEIRLKLHAAHSGRIMAEFLTPLVLCKLIYYM